MGVSLFSAFVQLLLLLKPKTAPLCKAIIDCSNVLGVIQIRGFILPADWLRAMHYLLLACFLLLLAKYNSKCMHTLLLIAQNSQLSVTGNIVLMAEICLEILEEMREGASLY